MRLKFFTAVDEACLRQIVGSATFQRGREYADRGAVVNLQWPEKAARVFGQVHGTHRTPYTAIATLGTGPDGRLTTFHSSCTCPVAVNCKHGVALTLAAMPGCGATENIASWEQSLTGLMNDLAPDQLSHTATVGLQFDLITQSARPVFGAIAAEFRLGLRPVLPGRNGNWVRTGISWSSLSYRASSSGVSASHFRLLAEIEALSSFGRSYYSPQETTIYLESFQSRRIWDLLAEAQAIGLPLVRNGRPHASVVVHTEPAELTLDLTRSEELVMQRRVMVAGGPVLLRSSLLLGRPAHGIAWWQTPDEPQPKERILRLAPMAAPVDTGMRDLLARGPVRIPAADEARFLREYYPGLRQRVPIVSADESVDLPVLRPPVLCLAVEQSTGQRVILSWNWTYTVGDTDRQEPLWPVEGAPSSRDLALEDEILGPVTPVTGTLPELHEVHLGRHRLAAARSLSGMATVRFLTEVLPRLVEVPGLQIEVTGLLSSYREAENAPVISVSGSESSDDRDWFDLAVLVSVDGEDVPFNQLFVALAESEDYLILPSGTYFALDQKELQELAKLSASPRVCKRRCARTSTLGSTGWPSCLQTGSAVCWRMRWDSVRPCRPWP
jgi:hypothetical protein